MAPLSNIVAALASHAGWKDPRQDEDGAYRFRLENGLDFAVFSPDDRVVVLRADITALPAAAMEREEMLRDAAKRQAGVCRTRASVAAVEPAGQSLLKSDSAPGDRLILYRMADLAAGQENFDLVARDFLNDLAWWKASFGGVRSERRTDQPFFSMSGMFGGLY